MANKLGLWWWSQLFRGSKCACGFGGGVLAAERATLCGILVAVGLQFGSGGGGETAAKPAVFCPCVPVTPYI
jgi:hypothetical protein